MRHKCPPMVAAAWLLSAVFSAISSASVRSDDRVCNLRVADLEILEGTLEDEAVPDHEADNWTRWGFDPLVLARVPYVTLEGQGEAFLSSGAFDAPNPSQSPRDANLPEQILSIRVPAGQSVVRGTLFRPNQNGQGMVAVRFRFNPTGAGLDHSNSRFLLAKAVHYQALVNRQLPGAAWFRYQQKQALNLAGRAGVPLNPGFRQGGEEALERSLAFFGGNRAIRENLQLEREIVERPGAGPQDLTPTVSVETIPGISVAAIDWASRIAGKTPELDPLAAAIPADQHAVFFPHLEAVLTLSRVQNLHGSLPALRILADASAGRDLFDRYTRELAIGPDSLAALRQIPSIRSLAVTGSDPYFEEGTDVAILFETTDPAPLINLLRQLYETRKADQPDAIFQESREANQTQLLSLVAPAGEVQSYTGVAGSTVVLTNSAAQRHRILETIARTKPCLKDVPEYLFFRDRYRREPESESAFLVLSDETIRRWCGPRWRIAASRRRRAATWLAEIQSAHASDVVLGRKAESLAAPTGALPLGVLDWSTQGVHSSTYGRTRALKPILEIPLEQVTLAEANAYAFWRDGYQRNWRGVFDPIAVRVSASDERLETDLSVMPLITSSDYTPLIQRVGNSKISATAGDLHPESIFHAIMAIDQKSPLFQQGNVLAGSVVQGLGTTALGWVGATMSLFLDQDPFWDELAQSKSSEQFLGQNLTRAPVALHVDVTDSVRLALFLSALRLFAQQSAPGALTWTNPEYQGKPYVCVSAGANGPVSGLELFYTSTPRSLLISLNENVIHRFLDRQEKPASDQPRDAWLGESVSARINADGIRTIGHAAGSTFTEQLQIMAWNNLPILNEWKRLYPDRDPAQVHHELWGETLRCPGNGQYVWNDQWQTMESTVFGCPAEPKQADDMAQPLFGIDQAGMGVSFGEGGLRGRLRLDWTKAR